VPAIERVPFDDLPREAAARAARLQRAEELESLVRVKDSMLWSALQALLPSPLLFLLSLAEPRAPSPCHHQ